MSPVPDTHAEAWSLLPWLANGRLPAAEREWLDAHVLSCAECRQELANQRALAGQMRAADAAVDAAGDEQRSFDKLWSRIEAAEAATPAVSATGTGASAPARRGSRTVRWLAAAVIVQGIGLALFGFNALRAPPAAATGEFTTVTTVTPVRGDAPRLSRCSHPTRPWAASTRCWPTRG